MSISNGDSGLSVRQKLNGALVPELNVAYWLQLAGVTGFNNTSHKLSTIANYATIFSLLTGLVDDDELDNVAVRSAIAFAISIGGGTVILPAGTGVMNNAAKPNQPIVLPVANHTAFTGTPVNILGPGQAACNLSWPSDSGTTGSNAALWCGDVTGTVGNSLGRYSSSYFSGYCQGFTMTGPNVSGTLGTVNANLTGMKWGSRRRMLSVTIRGFYAGMDIVGDHTVHTDLTINNCYYDLYINNPSVSLYGAVIFEKCHFEGAYFAALGMHPSAKLDGYAFNNRSFLGTSPYGIFKEAGAGQNDFMVDSTFNGLMFEKIGNAAIHDDNGGHDAAGAKLANIINTVFNLPFFSWNASYKITARDRPACINVNTVQGLRIENLIQPANWIPTSCTKAMFYFDSQAFFVSGDIERMMAGQVSTGVTIQSGGNERRFSWEQRGDNNPAWRGRMYKCYTTAITADKVVVQMQSNGVAPAAAGSTTAPILGVSLNACAVQTGTLDPLCAVIEDGSEVPVTTSGTATTNTLGKVGGTDGTVSDSTGFGVGRVVGLMRSVSGGVAKVHLGLMR